MVLEVKAGMPLWGKRKCERIEKTRKFVDEHVYKG
jgi:hypothetical protein